MKNKLATRVLCRNHLVWTSMLPNQPISGLLGPYKHPSHLFERLSRRLFSLHWLGLCLHRTPPLSRPVVGGPQLATRYSSLFLVAQQLCFAALSYLQLFSPYPWYPSQPLPDPSQRHRHIAARCLTIHPIADKGSSLLDSYTFPLPPALLIQGTVLQLQEVGAEDYLDPAGWRHSAL